MSKDKPVTIVYSPNSCSHGWRLAAVSRPLRPRGQGGPRRLRFESQRQESGKLLRVETCDPPVDQVADPGNAPGIGVITHAAPVLPVNARPTAPSISF